MCTACITSPTRFACDPVWPAGTAQSDKEPLAFIQAVRGDETLVVNGSEVTCSLGSYYLRRLFFVGADLRATEIEAEPNYDLFFPTRQMEQDFEALNFGPGNVAIEVLQLSKEGYQMSLIQTTVQPEPSAAPGI